MGVVTGYFNGWIDAVISRIIGVTMALPAPLFVIAVAGTRRAPHDARVQPARRRPTRQLRTRAKA
jgi:ABC-type dipeptide/oligopeptide/nickel transport system permease subunit